MSDSPRRYRIGVDVGGTFTDVVLSDVEGGGLTAVKVPTTPENRVSGVMDGLLAVRRAAGVDSSQIREIVHGSTAGTNALIERSGARVGFLTTEGFRDILEIGRVQRPMDGLYDFRVDRPPPLVPRHLCLEVGERIDADGSVVRRLDEDSVHASAQLFADHSVEAVAICFLFSHLNPIHEERAAAILTSLLPGLPISLSSHVSPEYREYERASTTVMNAYLAPVMTGYLRSLGRSIGEETPDAGLSIIQANGGSTTAGFASSRPVSTVNSGPCGGVVAAAWYGRRNNRNRVVSIDMGGTSFDIGLVEDGASRVTTEGDFQGLPVKIPIIDLHIIGAGGGSVAWIDSGGALNVGPHSAGADPGPACYGNGGDAPTVTDANLVLGRLGATNFNAGRMSLDAEAARHAFVRLAERMNSSVEAAAMGVVRVVNANMTRGIASVTIRRGIDVRDFALMSFGGAGGLHAVDLARELYIDEVVVPPLPGTFSAIGLLATDMRYDYVTAAGGVPAEEADPAQLEAWFNQMEAAGRTDLSERGYSGSAIRQIRFADLKVSGQTYELLLPLPDQGRVSRDGIARLVEAFSRLYQQRYAYFHEGEPVVIVNLRVCAQGINPDVFLPKPGRGSTVPDDAITGSRKVWFDETCGIETPIYDRAGLAFGMTVRGPAVIEEDTSSTLIPPLAAASVLPDLGLAVSPGGHGEASQ